jgi:hypothetical protein
MRLAKCTDQRSQRCSLKDRSEERQQPSFCDLSSQIVNHQPAEGKEDDNTAIEDPLVLLRPSFDHPDSVTTDA